MHAQITSWLLGVSYTISELLTLNVHSVTLTSVTLSISLSFKFTDCLKWANVDQSNYKQFFRNCVEACIVAFQQVKWNWPYFYNGTSHVHKQWIPGHFFSPTSPGYLKLHREVPLSTLALNFLGCSALQQLLFYAHRRRLRGTMRPTFASQPCSMSLIWR